MDIKEAVSSLSKWRFHLILFKKYKHYTLNYSPINKKNTTT